MLFESFGTSKLKRMIIMEDLSNKGYAFIPTTKGYSIPEAKAILKRVATFHAIGAVIQEEEPNIFAGLKIGRFNREVDGFDGFNRSNFDAAIDTISDWPEFSIYTEKLRRIQSEFVERYYKACDVRPHQFNTLIHHDVYCPNIMLKSSNLMAEHPFESVMLIDFQFVHWNSPTIDLYNFLCTSVKDELMPQCFDELIEFYSEYLGYVLRKLKYKKSIPTSTEIKAQFQERKFLGFMLSCLFRPLVQYRAEISTDVLIQYSEESLMGKRAIFQNEKVREILRKMIPFYDAMGAFD